MAGRGIFMILVVVVVMGFLSVPVRSQLDDIRYVMGYTTNDADKLVTRDLVNFESATKDRESVFNILIKDVQNDIATTPIPFQKNYSKVSKKYKDVTIFADYSCYSDPPGGIVTEDECRRCMTYLIGMFILDDPDAREQLPFGVSREAPLPKDDKDVPKEETMNYEFTYKRYLGANFKLNKCIFRYEPSPY